MEISIKTEGETYWVGDSYSWDKTPVDIEISDEHVEIQYCANNSQQGVRLRTTEILALAELIQHLQPGNNR